MATSIFIYHAEFTSEWLLLEALFVFFFSNCQLTGRLSSICGRVPDFLFISFIGSSLFWRDGHDRPLLGRVWGGFFSPEPRFQLAAHATTLALFRSTWQKNFATRTFLGYFLSSRSASCKPLDTSLFSSLLQDLVFFLPQQLHSRHFFRFSARHSRRNFSCHFSRRYRDLSKRFPVYRFSARHKTCRRSFFVIFRKTHNQRTFPSFHSKTLSKRFLFSARHPTAGTFFSQQDHSSLGIFSARHRAMFRILFHFLVVPPFLARRTLSVGVCISSRYFKSPWLCLNERSRMPL